MGFQDLATTERELSEYSGGESLVSKTMVGVEVALDHELNQWTKNRSRGLTWRMVCLIPTGPSDVVEKSTKGAYRNWREERDKGEQSRHIWCLNCNLIWERHKNAPEGEKKPHK